MCDELAVPLLGVPMNSLAAGARAVKVTIIESARRAHGRPPRRENAGLGLARLRQTCEICGDPFHLRSAPDWGTSITASLRRAPVDRPPRGDLPAASWAWCAADPQRAAHSADRSDTDRHHFRSQALHHDRGPVHEPRRAHQAQTEGPAASRAA